MAEEKWVTWDGLKYYDTKIKLHVDNELSELEDELELKFAEKAALQDLSNKFDSVKEDCDEAVIKVNTFANIVQRNTDDITSLQNSRLEIASELSSVKTQLQSMPTKSDLNDYVEESSLRDGYYDKGDVNTLVAELRGESNVLSEQIDGIKTSLTDANADLSTLKTAVAVIDSEKADKNHKHFLSDILDYENPDLTPYATKEYVANKILEAELNDVELKDIYTRSEVDQLLSVINTTSATNAADINNLNNRVSDLKQYQDIDHEKLEGLLVNLENKADENHKHNLSDIVDYSAPDLSNYATKHDLTHYYDKEEVRDLIPTNVSELINDAGFLTEHQDLSDYAKIDIVEELQEKVTNNSSLLEKLAESVEESSELIEDNSNAIQLITSDLSDVEKDVEELKESVKNIQPTVDLSNYVTKTELEIAIQQKSDAVLFTEDYVVTNPVGNFTANQSVNGLTIEEIIKNILGLKLKTTPESPEGSSDVVQEIVEKKTPIYSQDASGALVASEFEHVVWTAEQAANPLQDLSAFYQIVDDNGKVIESGYQEKTTYNEEAYLTVALPEDVEDVTIKVWDPDINDWGPVTWKLVKKEQSNISGYNIWTIPEEYEVLSGDTYRFVINN